MDKVQVLIVEDEAIVSMDLRFKLEAMGYEVPAETSTGEEAVDAVSKHHPDVVLMDIRLSGEMDGIAAAAEIRRRFKIPVVYLTSYGDEDTLQRAKATGPVGYLLKPFDDAVLRAVVETAIQYAEGGNLRKINERKDAPGEARAIEDGFL